MLGNHGPKQARQRIMHKLLAILLAAFLGINLASCSPTQGAMPKSNRNPLTSRFVKLSEVSPPATLRELRQAMVAYQPQVKILSPRSDEVLQDTEASVRFQVKDLPLFQSEAFGLGPHLHVIVDNQSYGAVYDVSEPLELKDLEPGTHTLRVFASRPWHESFKNEGAYAQTTFHVFTKTPENNPDLNLPLLTYSRPKDSYGAEPVMLDFYLANAPLHLVAQENAADDIVDWQVRCTINGESFLIDRWEPIYLKGLKPGKNWIQLELLDEQGNPYPNAFNNTARLIDYQPGGQDALSKLVRGELSAAEAFAIVDPNYVYVPEPELEVPIAPPEIVPTNSEPASEAVPEPTLEPGLELAPESIAPSPLAEPNSPTSPPAFTQESTQEIEPVSPRKLKSDELIGEKIKEQLPEEVEDLLKAEPSLSSPSNSAAPQTEPLQGTTAPAVEAKEIPEKIPVVELDKQPDPPSVPSPPQATKPLLRQWRDRLKQFIPLPEPDSAKSDKSDLPSNPPSVEPLPEIIDVPAEGEVPDSIAAPAL